jgi:hypothetical protein
VLLQIPRPPLLVFIKYLLQYLSQRYLNYVIPQKGDRWWDADRARVGAVAQVLYELHRERQLGKALVDVSKQGTSLDSCPLQRAWVLGISALGEDMLSSLADHLLAVWADKLSMNYTPVSVQEGSRDIVYR